MKFKLLARFYFLLAISSTLTVGSIVQENKPCTYSIRSDSSWKPQQLVGPDSSGEIVGHSVRSNTGSCTFLVDVGAGKQLLKIYNPNGETKELGQLNRPGFGGGPLG